MKVLNIKKDYPQLKDGIYIGRENKTYKLKSSKWHNPFIMKNESDRDRVLILYEDYIRKNENLWNALEELDGYNLYCWCSPAKCHGDVLIKLINEKKCSIFH